MWPLNSTTTSNDKKWRINFLSFQGNFSNVRYVGLSLVKKNNNFYSNPHCSNKKASSYFHSTFYDNKLNRATIVNPRKAQIAKPSNVVKSQRGIFDCQLFTFPNELICLPLPEAVKLDYLELFDFGWSKTFLTNCSQYLFRSLWEIKFWFTSDSFFPTASSWDNPIGCILLG